MATYKIHPRINFGFFLTALVLLTLGCNRLPTFQSRTSDFNFDWRFKLNAPEEAIYPGYNDASWRSLKLPHDWVVENSCDSTLTFYQATGRIPGEGIGWYRKSFPTDLDEDQLCYVLFDGVYNNTDVWINGIHLGFHPYGYAPFYYNLTPHLNRNGKDNVIVVKVDHRRYADSRWYTGAGIYRNVELIKTSKLHIPIWGAFVTTPKVSTTSSTVNLQIEVLNRFGDPKSAQIITTIYDPDGKEIGHQKSQIEVADSSRIYQVIKINEPVLWSTENPKLYRALTTIRMDGEVVDEYLTTFGIRSIRFDADEGFFLNEKNLKIKGVCLHHDAGLVGSAVPKGVWKRRLQILKDAGCNAIRSAHNPASDEFLDLCDEMGFLVQDEFFDEWDNPKDKRFNMNQQSVHFETQGYGEHFQDWAHQDIKTVMLSHRNHPSIIQWSIGNEIEWTYPRNQDATGFFNNIEWTGNYFWSEPPYPPAKISEMLNSLPKDTYDIGETAWKLAQWTKAFDTTRPVTANCILPSVSHLNGYADALDMVGYSYRRVLYDYGHHHYPEKPIMGMENVPQFHEWKAVMERPHIAGTYLWTGIDYMGEIRGPWPAKTNGSGLMDLAGFTKPAYHMYKSLWSGEPHIYMSTNIHDQIRYSGKPIYLVNEKMEVDQYTPGAWEHFVWGWQTVNEHWNYKMGDTVIVEVITNCESAELFLNEKSLGSKNRKSHEDNILKWAVIYEPGELKVVGTDESDPVAYGLKTVDQSTQIQVQADKTSILANEYDVIHVIVQLTDDHGAPSQLDDRLIEFEVDEKLQVLGVDNGSANSAQDFQATKVWTDRGRALLIAQAGNQPGKAKIGIKSEGLPAQFIEVGVFKEPEF